MYEPTQDEINECPHCLNPDDRHKNCKAAPNTPLVKGFRTFVRKYTSNNNLTNPIYD